MSGRMKWARKDDAMASWQKFVGLTEISLKNALRLKGL